MDERNTYDIGDRIRLLFLFWTKPTEGAIDADSTLLTVRDPSGYQVNDSVIIEGAGALGGDFLATVDAVVGNTLTLASAASTTVRRGRVGKLTNPSTPRGRVLAPGVAVADVSLTPLSTGIYEGFHSAAVEGTHWYLGDGQGTAQAAGERSFAVRPPKVPRA